MHLDISNWNGFDWLLAGIVTFSAVRALFRGLVRTLFSIVGIIGGFQLASWNYAPAGLWLVRHRVMASFATARVVAFIALAIAVIVVFEFVGRGIKKGAHAVGLGLFDRLFGGLFGFGRGVLIGVAVILLVSAVAPQGEWIATSRLTSHFLAAAHAVSFGVPSNLKSDLRF